MLVCSIMVAFLACKSDDGDPIDTNTETTTVTETETQTETETETETGTEVVWDCVIEEGTDPDYSDAMGCFDDFAILSSEPLDASIPGATSVKTVMDRVDSNALYFQNSGRFPIHWDFASANLSGNGLPLVPDLGTFNSIEYYSPDRRFILGAVSWYDGPQVWVYEISPYDTATADMIEQAYLAIAENTYFGDELFFHPTSLNVEIVAEGLSDDVKIITTDELFAGVDYQPLNLATSMGRLAFYTAEDLEDSYVNYREIVVLDAVPNDIAVVAGIVTGTFQTPLSHINVLSQNRGTPNMALRDADTDPIFTDLEDKWVELTVEAQDFSIREVTQAEADAWWEENAPEPADVSDMDTSVTGLWNVEDILDVDGLGLEGALQAAIPAFGGKGSHFGGLALIDDFPNPEGFVIPVHYYDAHMEAHGLWDVAAAMMAEKEFQGNPEYRAGKLQELRDLIEFSPIDPDLVAMVEQKIIDGHAAELYPVTRFRFRSSTNAEDVNGFNGAGLYTSKSGDPNDAEDTVAAAMGRVWASVWTYKAYDERQYYGIDHLKIGMALLCHRSFPDEEANGVAITANIFDTTGMEPGFYVNVQDGEESVVLPDAGVTTDQFVYYYDFPGQPIVYLAHSNLIPDGTTVLTTQQVYELGVGLSKIHAYFFEVYGSIEVGSFYGMDIEFKFDDDDTGEEQLYIKQARPYPGWAN